MARDGGDAQRARMVVATEFRDANTITRRSQHVITTPEHVKFEREDFPAFFKSGGIKVDKHGDIELTFTVPQKYAEKFAQFTAAMRYPLHVIVERWEGPDGTAR